MCLLEIIKINAYFKVVKLFANILFVSERKYFCLISMSYLGNWIIWNKEELSYKKKLNLRMYVVFSTKLNTFWVTFYYYYYYFLIFRIIILGYK